MYDFFSNPAASVVFIFTYLFFFSLSIVLGNYGLAVLFVVGTLVNISNIYTHLWCYKNE